MNSLSFLPINTFAEEYECNTLIPVDTVATVRTEKFIYQDLVALAYHIKDEIHEKFGYTVNIGIANNKLCAKMASDFEKPNKVHTLYRDEIEEKLWPLPIGDLF